jgi:class 3 adenylate cyclase
MLRVGVIKCPVCHREIPDDFIYCGYCGADVAAPPEDVPEERRVVTSLFCDLVEFTATSQNQDPEDVRARIAPYFSRLRASAVAYGGTVEKYIGDAIEAVFGVPHAHEDDPERAVRAGLLILSEIHDLNAANPALELRVRIGIHTGEVLARLAPLHDQSQGMVTGAVVNMASRLQTAAPEGTIVVSTATYDATREIFEYERLPDATLKGIREAVPIWRPIVARANLRPDMSRPVAAHRDHPRRARHREDSARDRVEPAPG